MAPARLRKGWRWKRRLQGETEESPGMTHEESVSEAKNAIREGRQLLSDVGRLGDQVSEVADRLKVKGSRNHFSERVGEMLRAQGGGSGAPSPKGG